MVAHLKEGTTRSVTHQTLKSVLLVAYCTFTAIACGCGEPLDGVTVIVSV